MVALTTYLRLKYAHFLAAKIALTSKLLAHNQLVV